MRAMSRVCFDRSARTSLLSQPRAGTSWLLLASRCRSGSSKMGMIPVGGVVMTPAGDLGADFVVHIVVSAPAERVDGTGCVRAPQCWCETSKVDRFLECSEAPVRTLSVRVRWATFGVS